jgi:hypothetical protein
MLEIMRTGEGTGLISADSAELVRIVLQRLAQKYGLH